MTTLSFAAPWLLTGLVVLPLLWWLLRITPPAPRRQEFPAIGLLLGLTASETTASSTPPFLLLLRLAAAALAIVGLAGPVRNAARPPAASGPLLLVIDNGWAAAPDWSDRIRAAGVSVAGAGPADTPVHVLTTASDPDGTAPGLGPAMTVSELASHLAPLRPVPWPPDRGAAARVLMTLPAQTRVIYVADGLATTAAGGAQFIAALRRFAGVTELRGTLATQLLRPPVIGPDQFTLRGENLAGHPLTVPVRAVGSAGETLSETAFRFAADGHGAGTLVLPPELRNRVVALRLGGQVSAGGVVLLDESSKRRPVGLLSRAGAEDEPLTGALFYLRRALGRDVELRSGDARALLSGEISVIMLVDQLVSDADTLAALTAWVRRGGVLVRFAGPDLAAATAPDPLLPVTLLAGDRALGGAMSWSRPAALAPFPPGSPFAGLAVPQEVRVTRQVLAQPGDAPDRPGRQDWATLVDGTPLVTAAPLGAGRLVLFHVTANAAWSNLPLSGLFPDMLHRLVALSAGVKPQAATVSLPPRRALDGFGQLGTPGAAARPLQAASLTADAAPLIVPDPQHPPGLYGADNTTRAFNLGAALPPLVAAPAVPGATEAGLNGAPASRSYGPAFLALALTLVAIDLVIALGLRGLLRLAAMLMLATLPLRGVQAAETASGAATAAMPSLATHLAYIRTADAQADGISQAGLQGLSDFVNGRTAAALAEPVGVDPSVDELSFYPLLYWPVLADAPVPDGATLAKLDDYMDNGGIILFDTRDGDTPDSGARAALRRIGAALAIPPLAPLTTMHVLTRAFYLLRSWPGRLAVGDVWVARAEDRANDSVSPVIVGAGDWAAAWATDASGANPYETLPGGEPQRLLAYRFGVNLVMYALTGNYKADQVHVPELLRRIAPDNGNQGGDSP